MPNLRFKRTPTCKSRVECINSERILCTAIGANGDADEDGPKITGETAKLLSPILKRLPGGPKNMKTASASLGLSTLAALGPRFGVAGGGFPDDFVPGGGGEDSRADEKKTKSATNFVGRRSPGDGHSEGGGDRLSREEFLS